MPTYRNVPVRALDRRVSRFGGGRREKRRETFPKRESHTHHSIPTLSCAGRLAYGASEDVLSCEPELAGRVEAPVVDAVVVALGQQLDLTVGFLVHFHHAVHDGNVAVFDLEHYHLAHADRVVLVVEKQNVAAPAGEESHRPRGLAPQSASSARALSRPTPRNLPPRRAFWESDAARSLERRLLRFEGKRRVILGERFFEREKRTRPLPISAVSALSRRATSLDAVVFFVSNGVAPTSPKKDRASVAQ